MCIGIGIGIFILFVIFRRYDFGRWCLLRRRRCCCGCDTVIRFTVVMFLFIVVVFNVFIFIVVCIAIGIDGGAIVGRRRLVLLHCWHRRRLRC